jgi:hypothetical protein
MEKANIHLSKRNISIAILIITLSVTTILHAQNKTVVIPLFDNESAEPQTQYFVVGGEAFVPGSNVDYINTY